MDSEFDKFLFASASNGKNEMPVTVLSALARRDIDPWQEAAKLAELPEYAAIDRLAAVIEQLPDESLTRHESGKTAARLIALLPRRALSPGASVSGSGGTKPRVSINIYVAVVAVLLGAQFAMAVLHASPQADAAHAPVINTFYPQTPPSSVDK